MIVRLATLVPALALRAAGALTDTARTNALAAATALVQQVSERRQLAPGNDDGPGALARLSREDCLALLAERHVGRLAYIARAGVPDIVPVNYVLDGTDVLIRSGAGPKLQAAERREVLVLEVDDVDEDSHTGWSVIAVGPSRRLTAQQWAALPVVPAVWARGPRHAVIRIRPSRIEGRRLT